MPRDRCNIFATLKEISYFYKLRTRARWKHEAAEGSAAACGWVGMTENTALDHPQSLLDAAVRNGAGSASPAAGPYRSWHRVYVRQLRPLSTGNAGSSPFQLSKGRCLFSSSRPPRWFLVRHSNSFGRCGLVDGRRLCHQQLVSSNLSGFGHARMLG